MIYETPKLIESDRRRSQLIEVGMEQLCIFAKTTVKSRSAIYGVYMEMPSKKTEA